MAETKKIIVQELKQKWWFRAGNVFKYLILIGAFFAPLITSSTAKWYMDSIINVILWYLIMQIIWLIIKYIILGPQNNKKNKMINTKNTSKKTLDNKEAQDNKIIAAIGYIWILFLIPLLLKSKNEYCQFHAKQGLVLFGFSILISIIGVVPVLGWLIGFFGWIVVIIFTVLGFVNALQGRKWKMPYLGKFAKKINL